jgi:hypothetical protein
VSPSRWKPCTETAGAIALRPFGAPLERASPRPARPPAALSARRVAARLQRAFHLKYVRYPP